jgi:hypothetical protein
MADVGCYVRGVVVDGQLTSAALVSYLRLPDTATLAQAVSGIAVWAAAMDGVIDGAFQQVQLTLTPPLPGGLKAPTGPTWAASRVEQTGVFDFTVTGTSRIYGQAVPSLSNSVITSGHIDNANAAIIALENLLTNPTGFFTNPQLQSLEAVRDTLISFRKRAMLRERSLEI